MYYLYIHPSSTYLAHLIQRVVRVIAITSLKLLGRWIKKLYINVPLVSLINICDFGANSRLNMSARSNNTILLTELSSCLIRILISGLTLKLFNFYYNQKSKMITTSSHSLTLSEWLLFNANSAIFQLYHDENKLVFNEIMMRSALFKTKSFIIPSPTKLKRDIVTLPSVASLWTL